MISRMTKMEYNITFIFLDNIDMIEIVVETSTFAKGNKCKIPCKINEVLDFFYQTKLGGMILNERTSFELIINPLQNRSNKMLKKNMGFFQDVLNKL